MNRLEDYYKLKRKLMEGWSVLPEPYDLKDRYDEQIHHARLNGNIELLNKLKKLKTNL